MPEPLQTAAMRTSWRISPAPSISACGDFDAREGGLFDGVGGQDGLGDLLKVVRLRAEDLASSGSAAMSFSAGSGTPMTPVEEGNTSSGLQAKVSCGGLASGAGGVDAGLAGGAVGVAGVDGDHADFAAGGAEMLSVHKQRRGFDAIAGESGGGDAGASATIKAKSVRPLCLSPALVAPKRNPRGMTN